MSEYLFTKTPVNYAQLWDDVVAVPTVSVLVSVAQVTGPGGENIGITYDGDLSAEELTAVTAAVDAHVPQDVYGFVTTTMVVQPERVVTDRDWVDIGGVVTALEEFTADASAIRARIVGDYKSDGAIELRIVTSDGTPLNETPIKLEDSKGVWTPFSGTTDTRPPTLKLDRYLLQARLLSGTSATLRFVSISLLLKTN